MSWLRRKLTWARANPLFWAHLLLLLLSVLLIFTWPGPMLATGPSDLRLRMWGLALQLIGVVTVWLDLTRTARQFGKPGFVRQTWMWLKAFFELGVVSISSGGSLGTLTGRARIKQRRSIQPNAPLPDRVTTLETNVEKIDEDLDAAFQEIDQRANELEGKIQRESEKRGAAIGEVTKSLDDAVSGNLATLVFGIVWLAIGVVLATLAPEIVKIVDGQWCEVRRAL